MDKPLHDGAHTDCKEKANESDGYNCYNEFMEEGIWANLLITCDFLGSLEKNVFLRL